MNKLVDLSTVLAAAAGLWALGLAWFTYVMAVHAQNENEFLALKSIVKGLQVELGMMWAWTGGETEGYSKDMKLGDEPADWSQPGRLIYKFSFDAISNLSTSPYLYALGDIVGPFARLNLSISRLFQVYDEYRSFVNSNWEHRTSATYKGAFESKVLRFNFVMHVTLIGGADSADPECLYKTYRNAVSALDSFGKTLKARSLPWWFAFGHVVGSACLVSGSLLLFHLFR
jgi:hypothetical protein